MILPSGCFVCIDVIEQCDISLLRACFTQTTSHGLLLNPVLVASCSAGVRVRGPLHGLLQLRPLDHGGHVAWGDRVKAVGVRRHGKGRRPGIDQEGLAVEIRHVVTLGVVVGVQSHAGLAAKQLGLFLGLDRLRAGEEASRGDAVENKGLVVGAAVELGRHERLADRRVVVLEEPLDLRRAGRPRQVEGRAVAVIDHQGVVGGGDHVEVEIQADLGLLGGIEAVDVVVAAQQAELLRRPEAEAHRVLDREAGQRLGDDEVADDAGAVVVDAGPGLDRVRVATQRDDVVGVAALGLRDHVVGGTVLDLAVDPQVGCHRARLDHLDQRLSVREADAGDGSVGTQLAGRAAQSSRHRTLDIVVHECRRRPGLGAQDGFGRKGALAPRDQSNLARQIGGIVSLDAAQVVHHCQRRRGVYAGAVSHGCGVIGLAVDGESLVGSGPLVNLRLLVNVVVAGFLQLTVEVVDGVLVGPSTKDAVALGVGIGEVFQLLSALQKIPQMDHLGQDFL